MQLQTSFISTVLSVLMTPNEHLLYNTQLINQLTMNTYSNDVCFDIEFVFEHPDQYGYVWHQ